MHVLSYQIRDLNLYICPHPKVNLRCGALSPDLITSNVRLLL
jgi:hypothetical protein